MHNSTRSTRTNLSLLTHFVQSSARLAMISDGKHRTNATALPFCSMGLLAVCTKTGANIQTSVATRITVLICKYKTSCRGWEKGTSGPYFSKTAFPAPQYYMMPHSWSFVLAAWQKIGILWWLVCVIRSAKGWADGGVGGAEGGAYDLAVMYRSNWMAMSKFKVPIFPIGNWRRRYNSAKPVIWLVIPRPHRAEALSDDARLTSVCLSRTSGVGLCREQRGL